jgi:hypothetical protein
MNQKNDVDHRRIVPQVVLSIVTVKNFLIIVDNQPTVEKSSFHHDAESLRPQALAIQRVIIPGNDYKPLHGFAVPTRPKLDENAHHGICQSDNEKQDW